MKIIYASIVSCLWLSACQQGEKSTSTKEPMEVVELIENPAAEGFDIDNSDPKAIELADKVMVAMGGRKNWDNTRIICWNFFGARYLIWDKMSGDVRIEVPGQELTILLNLNSSQGRVQKQGLEFNQSDSLAKYLERGKSIWINDSYWLLMPYKLKDSGVTLKYLGEEKTQTGNIADALELTFEGIGRTPENRYEVCIDRDSKLVCQWEFFRHYEDDSSAFVNPWTDYDRYGEILLSGNRGKRQITDIAVLDSVPAAVFNSFDPVQLNNM